MLISHRRRFLFIHVPKAAGRSVRHALAPWAQEPQRFRIERPLPTVDGRPNPLYEMWLGTVYHVPARDVAKELPKEFRDYFKFAFVRNPYDALVSMYHFILQDESHPRRERVVSLGSFDEFVEWTVGEARPFPMMPSKLQKDYVTDERGDVIVDYLGRYETLLADFARICGRLEIEVVLPHHNRTSHRDYRSYYSARSRALVERHYGEDLALFGYDFEGIADPQAAAFSRNHLSM